ncbi:ABC transporter ATP-binding protein [Stomatohabitans albus]|uniref:ABC transporter ATP-binding protein n=1 Tax=Stomatohabitans albus TaxID=3110766 RepID=UPI00300D2162
MSGDLVIEVNNLTKSFQNKEVIKSCDINIQEGTIYGLLGANGAGKTTIFKLLSGMLFPTVGRIQIFDLDHEKNRDKILSNLGILIDTPIFYEHLSAVENLEIHLTYMGKENNIEDILSLVGLRDTGPQPVSTFSMGMRQRLAIARALVHKPQLLILDEPINGLDPIGIKEIRDLFLKLRDEQGITILLSSHILSEIEHVANTIGILVDGRIIEEVSMADVKERFPNGLEEYFLEIMGRGDQVD